MGWPSARAKTLVKRSSVWINGSPTFSAWEVQAVSYAADAMEPSRTPDLSWASEIGGAARVALREACAAAAVVRFCQVGAHLESLRLASRAAAAVEWMVRKREVSSRVSLETWFAGSLKRTALLSTL